MKRLLLALALCSLPAAAACTSPCVQHNTGTGFSSPKTLVFTSSVTLNNLIVGVAYVPTTITITCTDSLGNTFTSAAVFNDNGTIRAQMCFAPITIAGSDTMTYTASGSVGSGIEIIQEEYSGCATSSPLDKTNSSNGFGGAPVGPTLAAGGTNGELIWGALLSSNSTGAAGSGFTLSTSLSSGTYQAEFQVQSTAASIPVKFASVTGGWIVIAASFKPSGGGASCTPSLATLGAGCQ